jgi:hypothetical protein
MFDAARPDLVALNRHLNMLKQEAANGVVWHADMEALSRHVEAIKE